MNGQPVATLGEYLGALEGSKPRDTVELTLLRGQEKVKARVRLAQRPEPEE
jgi:S1-C subfamily serine protease